MLFSLEGFPQLYPCLVRLGIMGFFYVFLFRYISMVSLVQGGLITVTMFPSQRIQMKAVNTNPSLSPILTVHERHYLVDGPVPVTLIVTTDVRYTTNISIIIII